MIRGKPDILYRGVTALVYLGILKEYLPTILREDTIFIQDNISVYTAKIVKEWLEEIAIEVMKWPLYSPDLNPIENLWKRLKDEIMQAHPELASIENRVQAIEYMIRYIQEAWANLKDEWLEGLALGMQRRVDAVIQAKWWYTKY